MDADAGGLRSARIENGPYLMLTSWRILLDRMAAKVEADADYHTKIDIRQLQGLAEQQDTRSFPAAEAGGTRSAASTAR